MKPLRYFILLAFLTFFTSCTDTITEEPHAHMGQTMVIGAGTAYSWVSVDAKDKLTAIGVTITDAALASLPAKDTMFEIPISPDASDIAFKSISLDYAISDGSPYNKPHLDAHFYLWDMMQRMNIHAGADSMMPSNMTMPSGYKCLFESEDMMGVHWIDTTAPEWHGQPFQCGFVYGFSKGSLTFMEAMCDKAALDNHTAFSGSVRQPTMMGGMGGMMMSHPANYRVSYDAAAKSTKIELSGFTE